MPPPSDAPASSNLCHPEFMCFLENCLEFLNIRENDLTLNTLMDKTMIILYFILNTMTHMLG